MKAHHVMTDISPLNAHTRLDASKKPAEMAAYLCCLAMTDSLEEAENDLDRGSGSCTP
jgi:hypothetical protein